GIGLLQYVIGAGLARELRQPGRRVVEIPEHDRYRGTRLRARGGDVRVRDGTVLEARPVLRAADPLHAEGALLHHALLPYGDVRVEQHVQRVRPTFPLPARLRVVVPVEVTDLVRAVIRAVARSDTAVVHLSVEPVGRVIGGEHRAHRLAGREGALLAQHRRHGDVQAPPVFTRSPVALDPHPGHLPAPQDQILTDRRDVVLSVARRYAP